MALLAEEALDCDEMNRPRPVPPLRPLGEAPALDGDELERLRRDLAAWRAGPVADASQKVPPRLSRYSTWRRRRRRSTVRRSLCSVFTSPSRTCGAGAAAPSGGPFRTIV